MARNETADIKKYFSQKKAEADKAEDLLSQRSKTLAAFQRTVEEKYRSILEQETAFSEREKKLEEREKTLEEKERSFKEKSDTYGPAIQKWEQEKQDLLQNARDGYRRSVPINFSLRVYPLR